MKRSDFFKIAGSLAAAGPAHAFPQTERKMHIVTLSFDDGFAKSFRRIAAIYEKFSLSACFNIIATGHYRNTEVKDDYMKEGQLGDFSFWKELQDRGHEVMPHSYRHAHLADLPLEEAKGLILKCLDIFSKELRGFDPEKAVFNFPYNQSSHELEAWLSSVVMAFRTKGGGVNPLPGAETVKITTSGYGPDNCEKHLDQQIEKLLAQSVGWLVYNLHGLDEEGWGPIRPTYLERLLERLLEIDSVRIIPAARAIMQAREKSKE